MYLAYPMSPLQGGEVRSCSDPVDSELYTWLPGFTRGRPEGLDDALYMLKAKTRFHSQRARGWQFKRAWN